MVVRNLDAAFTQSAVRPRVSPAVQAQLGGRTFCPALAAFTSPALFHDNRQGSCAGDHKPAGGARTPRRFCRQATGSAAEDTELVVFLGCGHHLKLSQNGAEAGPGHDTGRGRPSLPGWLGNRPAPGGRVYLLTVADISPETSSQRLWKQL